jgi:hypothetical protein
MSTRRLFTVIFLFALLGLTATDATDPDMWWHLRTGEYILANGIPTHDVFSYTASDHRWVTHEWLSQVVMWGLYLAGGFPALIVFFSLLIAAALGLVYKVSEGRPYVAGFVTILAGMTAAPLWGSRPQMFNFFFLALYLFLIETYRRRVRQELTTWWIWGLVPLTALWANFHSGYLLGVVLIATYAIGDLVQRRLSPDDERVLPRRHGLLLGGVAIGALLAALLNPNGWHLWLYPFETLGSPVMQGRIVEWFSPDFHHLYNLPFALFLGIGALTFIFSPRKPTLTDLLLFAGTGFAGLVSIRHMPLFALTAIPIVSRFATAILMDQRWGTRLFANPPAPTPRPMAILNIIIAVAALLFPLARWAESIMEQEARVAEKYPVAAVAHLQASGLAEQPIYNSYNWGGYLIWHTIPVYVDGRADVYGDDFLRRYLHTVDVGRNWREALISEEVEVILIETYAPLVTVLTESGEWREAYRDEMAVIFVRQ